MILSRRSSLMLGLAASAATLMPRLALAQTETPTSFSYPVEGGQVVFHPVDHASMVIETPGGVFYIDGPSVLYLVGSTMDWVEDDFTAGFQFTNPNAKGACGCGESFMV